MQHQRGRLACGARRQAARHSPRTQSARGQLLHDVVITPVRVSAVAAVRSRVEGSSGVLISYGFPLVVVMVARGIQTERRTRPPAEAHAFGRKRTERCSHLLAITYDGDQHQHHAHEQRCWWKGEIAVATSHHLRYHASVPSGYGRVRVSAIPFRLESKP
jgi:hypothetical protein